MLAYNNRLRMNQWVK